MTQTRTFLILAWLMVATLLWMEWGKERDAPQASAPAIPTAVQATGPATPGIPVASVPGAVPAATAATQAVAAALPVVRLRNDVVALDLNGRDITRAELLKYQQSRDPGSPQVLLFDADPARHFAAHSAWRGNDGRELVLRRCPPRCGTGRRTRSRTWRCRP